MENKLVDLEERYREGDMKLREFRDEARKDVEFFLNKQYSDDEEAYLRSENRDIIVNNKIRRNIMLISGYMRMNQLGCRAYSQNDKYQEEADIASDAIQWLYVQRDGYAHLADCFLHGSLISGINFSEIVADYTYDSEVPDIKFVRVPYNAVIWDPYFTNLDLSDCGYIIRRKVLPKASVLGLLPQHASEIKKLKTFSGDGKFNEMPHVTNPNGQEQIAYTEMWERTTEKRSVLVDVETGMRIDLIKRGEEQRAEQLIAFDPRLKIVKTTIPTVKLNVFLNNEHIETADDPLNINDFPFVPIMGIYVPEHDDFALRLQSVLRVSRDPQRELNKRISKFLDILDTKTHVGWLFKKKALADGEDVYKSGNYRAIAIKHDAVIGQDIQQITPPPTDPSIMQSFTIFDNNIMENMGMNEAAFGAPQGGNDSGLLTMLRQQSAVLGLNNLFDNFYLSQRIHVRKTLQAMYRLWPTWKWKRITGKEQLPLGFRDPSFLKFNVVISQGVMTENQQKMYFSELIELRRLGVNIPDSVLIKEAPIQKKGDLLKEIQAIEQAQAQQAQQQAQLMQQQIAIQNAKVQSEIEENKADTVRANARAIADIGLTSAHIAEATQSRAKAALDTVKASQEIAISDQNALIEAMQFIESITDKKLQQNTQQLVVDKSIVDSTLQGQVEPQRMPQQPGI